MEIIGREMVNGHEVITVDVSKDESYIRLKEMESLRTGDKIETTTGEIFIFERWKRTKFVAKSVADGGFYDLPEQLFKKIVEKAGPKQINQSYKTLRPGDLFCIKGSRGECMLFKFKEIKNGKIKATEPIDGGNWTLDVSSYIGKLNEIK